MLGRRLVTSAEESDTFSRSVQAGVERWETYIFLKISLLMYYVAPTASLEAKWPCVDPALLFQDGCFDGTRLQKICWSVGQFVQPCIRRTICSALQDLLDVRVHLVQGPVGFHLQSEINLQIQIWAELTAGRGISGNKSCTGTWRITHLTGLGG